MERLMLTWASRGGVQQGSGHMLHWELGFRPITPCDMCPLDPEPTIEMKRSASKSVSTSSSAGNPTTLSGLRAELIAAAMRSGGVQARQREADCSAAKVSAAVLTWHSPRCCTTTASPTVARGTAPKRRRTSTRRLRSISNALRTGRVNGVGYRRRLPSTPAQQS